MQFVFKFNSSQVCMAYNGLHHFPLSSLFSLAGGSKRLIGCHFWCMCPKLRERKLYGWPGVPTVHIWDFNREVEMAPGVSLWRGWTATVSAPARSTNLDLISTKHRSRPKGRNDGRISSVGRFSLAGGSKRRIDCHFRCMCPKLRERKLNGWPRVPIVHIWDFNWEVEMALGVSLWWGWTTTVSAPARCTNQDLISTKHRSRPKGRNDGRIAWVSRFSLASGSKRLLVVTSGACAQN